MIVLCIIISTKPIDILIIIYIFNKNKYISGNYQVIYTVSRIEVEIVINNINTIKYFYFNSYVCVIYK